MVTQEYSQECRWRATRYFYISPPFGITNTVLVFHRTPHKVLCCVYIIWIRLCYLPLAYIFANDCQNSTNTHCNIQYNLQRVLVPWWRRHTSYLNLSHTPQSSHLKRIPAHFIIDIKNSTNKIYTYIYF